ncbi:hypothetical protein BGZ65_001917 [Modicella reniformis]|uniref:Uncharacterized protein n=1 Tax=Modicella reniformis TaxID=1440133 RepID=A0A9P6SUG4_9FUNG|nr:hypothetical protein BGZ65_001917 [Modicella reniformis]
MLQHLYRRCCQVRSLTCTELELKNIKCILDRCTNTLVDLSLAIKIDDYPKKEKLQIEPEELTSLKKLTLLCSMDLSHKRGFWLWLCKRCSHVEEVIVERPSGFVKSLAEGMLTHMPNVNIIQLGRHSPGASYGLADMEAAELLSSSRKGWKAVKVKHTTEFGKASMEALANHFATLEMLVADQSADLEAYDWVLVLSSSTNLHSLIAIVDINKRLGEGHCIKANNFIDLDPIEGSLKPWLCGTTLRVLKIRISDIPRPDLKSKWVVKETYPGQGRDMQIQVYDRLARMTHLETLWLGHNEISWQFDCLEMSLDSGMFQLGGLRELSELNVSNMKTRIGVPEVEWMTSNWPRLRTIYGLNDQHNEAVQWLQQHHPEIVLVIYGAGRR